MLMLIHCCGFFMGGGESTVHNVFTVKFWMLVITGPNTSYDLFQLQVL